MSKYKYQIQPQKLSLGDDCYSTLWAVYRLNVKRGVECLVAEFPTEEQAEEFVKEMTNGNLST